MSNKKNSHNSDLEANLAKIANAKPRKRLRNDNIYERFITRVENVENAAEDTIESTDEDAKKTSALKPLKNANKLSSYEPLSEAELTLFVDQTQESKALQTADNISTSINSTRINLDFSDDDEDSIATQTSITKADESLNPDSSKGAVKNIQSDHQHIKSTSDVFDNNDVIDAAVDNKQPLKPKDKQASSKKLLVIGIVVGSLLIIAIVMTLLFTGVLSTSMPTNIPNSAEIPVADSKPDGSAEPVVIETLKDSQSAEANIAKTSIVQTKQNQGDISSPESVEKQQEQPETNVVEANPPITYEDFRQESQSMLYREVID